MQDPAWADCFVETITDYIVDQAKPEGYLTTDNADWLIERISKDGRIETKTEMELLVSVLDKARWAPQSLVRFALEQVKDAVVHGTGPLRSGKLLEPGVVSEADVDLLRRILYSFGGDGNLAVTQPEAEILFDIDAATADADNHPVLGRPVREGHRQLRDGGIGLRDAAARGGAGPRRLARPPRRPVARQDGLRHGHRAIKGLFGGYQRAVRRGTRHCPPRPSRRSRSSPTRP